MFKRAVAIAMAFTGVIVGAGFASGQEAMQYFVSFGTSGFWGVALAAALMMISGIAILQLGSYFQANEHTAVYDKVSGPITSKIMDWSTLITLFSGLPWTSRQPQQGAASRTALRVRSSPRSAVGTESPRPHEAGLRLAQGDGTEM